MAKRKFPQFSSTKTPTSQELRLFRSYVSQLKKQGLISGKKIDARVVRPNMRRGGKLLAELVNKSHRKLTAIPVKSSGSGSTAKIKPVKQAPPVAPSKKVNLKPLNKPLSFRDYPIKHKSFAGALNDLDENWEEVNAMKREGEKFAFQFDKENDRGNKVGLRSYVIFHDIRDLVEYLGKYEAVQKALHNYKRSEKLFDSLKLVRWNKSATEWKPGPQHLLRKNSKAGKQAKKRRK